MYDDARFIFREYVQNAADQIDVAVQLEILKDKTEGKIDIEIDALNHRIKISDNATGISTDDVLQFLGDVANSQKDSKKQKGFRGIGRLGGLGYCNKLIFETSYWGESIRSRMILDAKLLKRIIEDRKDPRDAAAAISVITTIEKEEEDPAEHYFRVTLDEVFSDKVLNVGEVTSYLSMVAPVPFSSSFSFTDSIKTYLKSRNLMLDEYNVELNGNTIFKGYKNSFREENDTISNLVGVDFVDIRNDDEQLIAVCWYGYRDLSNTVISDVNKERGIRIRTKNIAIGDESTCKRFFDAERTNLRFIGEIHTLSDDFIPNARRDYFNENATYQQFEKNAKDIFTQENLENRLAQTASKLHNRLSEIIRYKEAFEDFRDHRGEFENEATETYHLNKLKELEGKALKAKKVIEKIDNKAANFSNIRVLYKSIIGQNDINIEHLGTEDLQVSKYDPPNLANLTADQKKVVLEIFEILEEELEFNTSELIKKKIIEKYN
jgi:molecular chaperone HtpG